MLSSRVKIWGFRLKAHLVFHWCLYNKQMSLLPNFSKFFEKVMYNRLLEFAKTNEILILHQFGFRKNHSTSHALLHLLNKISSAIDQHVNTAGTFLGLSKVFDTLDHEILFTKLEHYGIRDAGLRWIKATVFIAINLVNSITLVPRCRQ